MLAPNQIRTDITLNSNRTVSLFKSNGKKAYSFYLDSNIADQIIKLYGPLPLVIEQLLAELLIQNIKDLDA